MEKEEGKQKSLADKPSVPTADRPSAPSSHRREWLESGWSEAPAWPLPAP